MTGLAGLANLGAEAAALVASLGSPVRRATALTSVPGSRRIAYRLDLEDGRTAKLRRGISLARAQLYTALLSHLDEPRLARVVERRGDVTLEEWVAGEALTEGEPAARHVEAAAALLAAIHRHAPPVHLVTEAADTAAAARAEVDASLDALIAAGALGPAFAARLRDAVVARAPRAAAARIVHTDLCGENLIAGAEGALRAVDNEGLRIGPPGYDLARVWYRWPMSDGAWAHFVAAYAERADPAPALAHFPFWQLAAVVRSARVRLRNGVAAAAIPLERLARLAETL